MKVVLLGDGDSPHLAKWTRGWAAQPGVELWAASTRGFAPEIAALLPDVRRLALNRRMRPEGGNVAVLAALPRLARWLARVDADWIHAHYLTSHGTLAWLARRGWRLRARVAASAWGSDVLVAPQASAVVRALTRRVLRDCDVATSDSRTMAAAMRGLGARDVMVFPFGLEALPPPPTGKDDALFFANRALEPVYAPERVIDQFARLAGEAGRLVVANDGSLRAALQARATALGIAERVRFVGRLDAATQAAHYAAARWYVSLPTSDSVAVSVLEAMAHGCVPLLSDLPANRELVRDGDNGLIVAAGAWLTSEALDALRPRLDAIGAANRAWVERHAMFAPAVGAFVERLRRVDAGAALP